MKTIQIIPATGWVAKYKDGTEYNVMVFALEENVDGETCIVGYSGGNILKCDDDTDGFEGYEFKGLK